MQDAVYISSLAVSRQSRPASRSNNRTAGDKASKTTVARNNHWQQRAGAAARRSIPNVYSPLHERQGGAVQRRRREPFGLECRQLARHLGLFRAILPGQVCQLVRVGLEIVELILLRRRAGWIEVAHI